MSACCKRQHYSVRQGCKPWDPCICSSTSLGILIRLTVLASDLKTVKTCGVRAPRRTVAEPGAAYGPPAGSGEENISASCH